MKNRLCQCAQLLGLAVALLGPLAAFARLGELALVSGPVREAAVAALRDRGRADAADFLLAVWAEDSAKLESAGLALLTREWDASVARILQHDYRRRKLADKAAAMAEEISRRERRARPAAATAHAADLSGRRPVVLLHGYEGDRETWTDFLREFSAAGYGEDDLLTFEYYAKSSAADDLSAGLTALGADTGTPIETLAAGVAANLRVWLRRRAQAGDQEPGSDSDLPACDFVAHSMGGLVLRKLMEDCPELVHRAVTLGTPHFGQNVSSSLTGYQTQQMKYGSSFLWQRAETWFYRAPPGDNVLFLVGAGENNSEIDSQVEWDGLVCAFSATLQTAADDDFARRTVYLNRIHSTVLKLLYDHRALTELSGPGDVAFRLVTDFLAETGDFAPGASPDRLAVLLADDADESRADAILGKATGRGGLFVQVRNPAPSTATALAGAIPYDPGKFFADSVVASLEHRTTGETYTPLTKKCFWEHGHSDEGCERGLVFIYGNLPPGDYAMTVAKPNTKTIPPGCTFPYEDHATIFGGGTRVIRTRPGCVPPLTRCALADDRGETFEVTVTNAWLAAQGLVANAEDLAGCVRVCAEPTAASLSVAACAWLGGDVAAGVPALRLTAIAAEGNVALRLGLWGRPLGPTAGARMKVALKPDAQVVVQSKAALGDEASWRDVELTAAGPEAQDWLVPGSDARFFRAVIRPVAGKE